MSKIMVGKELKASITKSGEVDESNDQRYRLLLARVRLALYVDAKAQGWTSVDHVTLVKNQ